MIKEIDLKKSHPNKDFGQAFYLSEEYMQAEEMAKFKVVIEGGTPVVNEFYFDEELLNGNEFGPIANDRVGCQITNFKEGYISFEEFLNRLKYMKGITFQYAFCTEKAISKLQVI